MDLIAILRAVQRRWYVVVIATMFGAVLGAGSLLFSGSTAAPGTAATYYRATNIQSANVNPLSTSGRAVNLDQVALMAITGDVPIRVAASLGLQPADITNVLSIENNDTTRTMSITAVARSPEMAVAIADGVANELSTSSAEAVAKEYADETATVNRRIDTLRNQMNELQAVQPGPGAPTGDVEAWRAQLNVLSAQLSRAYGSLVDLGDGGEPTGPLKPLDSARATQISGGEYGAIVARAQAGEQVVGSADGKGNGVVVPASGASNFGDPLSRGLLGAFLGLLIGVGIVVGMARFDRRLWTREGIEEAFDLPVLADIPTFRPEDDGCNSVVLHSQPMSPAAEGYRATRSILQFVCGDTLAGLGGSVPAARVLIVSASPGEGKSTTTANLAAAFAETGLRVLALNCDFRRPTLHQFFGSSDASTAVQTTPMANVALVGNVVGDQGAKPSEVVARQRTVIEAARPHFDLIVIDTAPLLSTNDALDLVADVDAVVVVARYGHTTGGHARRVTNLLRRVGAPAVGVVAVAASGENGASAYYYAYDTVAPSSFGVPTFTSAFPAGAVTAGVASFGTLPAAREPDEESPGVLVPDPNQGSFWMYTTRPGNGARGPNGADPAA